MRYFRHQSGCQRSTVGRVDHSIGRDRRPDAKPGRWRKFVCWTIGHKWAGPHQSQCRRCGHQRITESLVRSRIRQNRIDTPDPGEET